MVTPARSGIISWSEVCAQLLRAPASLPVAFRFVVFSREAEEEYGAVPKATHVGILGM